MNALTLETGVLDQYKLIERMVRSAFAKDKPKK